jgi:hypothetical protein
LTVRPIDAGEVVEVLSVRSPFRQQVANWFGLTPQVMRLIEQEGIAHEWPPL